MTTPYSVTVLTYPDALLLDIAGPVQVYATANRLSGKLLYSVQLAAMPGTSNPVTDTGLAITAALDFTANLPSGDLLIPGGPGVDALIGDAHLIATLTAQATHQARLISICSGSLLTAATGLLDGRAATCHWVRSPTLADQFPKVRWQPDAIYTIDGAFCCSAGVTAGIDLILALVERDHGSALALSIAREMVVYLRRSGGQMQYSRPLAAQHAAGSRIAALCAAITDDPSLDWTVQSMAEFAHMTERTLHRHFLRDLKQSPSGFVMSLRLDMARAYLDRGAGSLAMVALSVGLKNEQTLRRAFAQHIGITPAAYRGHFSARGAA